MQEQCGRCHGNGKIEEQAMIPGVDAKTGESRSQMGWVLVDCPSCYGTGLHNKLND